MLERTKRRSYFEDILCEEFDYITKEDLLILEERKTRSHSAKSNSFRNVNDISRSPNERNMTRKTRTRRPRIQVIQSGYCVICSVPYNSVEDHIQSKKHQKLIGEDANYIALNGYVHPDIGIESLLNLNGIEAIGLEHDFSPKVKRRIMPRTRASSLVTENIKPVSPCENDYAGHHLRSRKNINYMTPPLEEDSLPEKPDFESLPNNDYKEYRELRSSTRALAKLTAPLPSQNEQDVWNSGRPKRKCIHKQKRISADERLVADNKTYYKVEVMSNKLRSSDHAKEKELSKRLQSPKSNENDIEKGLIVKFKKLRNSELVQLNNEATNFLFPKKDESSEEEDEVDADGANTTVSSMEDRNDSTLLLSSDADDHETPTKFKVEDEASMDSMCSETKTKKKRRTHAEAFIMDNQKYYKFETPGSRLRYHGSYLSPIPLKSPKSDIGSTVPKLETEIKVEKEEKRKRKKEKLKICLDNYKFSFETVPKNESWYHTFLRQDKGEQRYNFTKNDCWNEFIMPYQMPHLKPLDPKLCIFSYKDLITNICNPLLACNSSVCSSPDRSVTGSVSSSIELELEDEDSKLSTATTESSTSITEEICSIDRKGRTVSVPSTSKKNPRKSPRQHASTLAILSSLIHQRKRRSKKPVINEPSAQNLSPIVEECEKEQVKAVVKKPRRKPKKHDYSAIASEIDDIFDTKFESNLEEGLEIEISDENPLGFQSSKVSVSDILRLYDDAKLKENEKSCRRFFNGTPGRKPGKRKKNKTGWPNKIRRKKVLKDKEEENEDSAVDSVSVNQDSEDDDVDSTNSIKNGSNDADLNKCINNKSGKALSDINNVEEKCDSNSSSNRVGNNEFNNKLLVDKMTNQTVMQPYVYVKKLDSSALVGTKIISSTKRTSRRQRRMPGSPKSPRMLRRPRGRWYRER